MLTSQQSETARALLGWSAHELAESAELNVATVFRFEAGAPIFATDRQAMEVALTRAGIGFVRDGQVTAAGGADARFLLRL
jgi:hypothetical protein